MDPPEQRANSDPNWLLGVTARVPDHVVSRSFEAETMLLNLDSGQYHGLNPTGGRWLELLDEADGDAGEAVRRLADECGVSADEITPDIAAFCSALRQRGLIEIDEG
jgi:Coenzyme PQQ synthesis protein D (PqqD)